MELSAKVFTLFANFRHSSNHHTEESEGELNAEQQVL
jgi:hypothetical protein